MLATILTNGFAALSAQAGEQVAVLATEAQTTNAAFSIRDGVGLVWFEGKLHMLGGWDPGVSPITKREHWVSEDLGVTWTQMPTPAWDYGRHTYVCVVYQDAIWCALNDVYNPTDQSVYRYTSTGGWEIISGNMGLLGQPVLYVSCVHNGWIYIVGGKNWETKAQRNSVHRYDGVTVEHVADFPVGMGPRDNACLWSFNDSLFLAGGGEYMEDGSHTYNDTIWRSDDDGVSWTQIGQNEIFAAQYGNAAQWDGKMWYLQGANIHKGGNMSGIWWSEDGTNWHLVKTSMQIPPRHASGFCGTPTALVVASGNMWNDAYKISETTVIV